MAYEGKTISVAEMRRLGLLQEINRRLLHPMGLALEVIVDKETGEERIERLWDSRDDPEGWYFEDGLIDAEKAKAVDSEFEKRAHNRMKTLGYVVQPLPQEPAVVQVRLLDHEARFAWRDGVWKVRHRDFDRIVAIGEQFSNVVEFKADPLPGEPSWFTEVRPM